MHASLRRLNALVLPVSVRIFSYAASNKNTVGFL